MKVIIIGSGQSGLVACKTFIEEGYDVRVLEKTSNNGLFYSIPEKDYFRWSSSRYISGFSDFPIPDQGTAWLTLRQYQHYLESYKQYFGLEKYIDYNCNVIQATPNKSGWKVTYENNNEYMVDYCDKLIISTGLNSVPKYPDLGSFKGLVLHTHDVYKMNKQQWQDTFRKKRVLVIGGGESAFDIGRVAVEYSEKVYYCSKNYIEWFPDAGRTTEENKEFEDCYRTADLGWNNIATPTDTHLNYIEYSLPTPVSGFWHNFGREIFVQCLGRPVRCSHNHKELCDLTDTPENLFSKYVVKRTPFMCDIHMGKVNLIKYPTQFQTNFVISEGKKYKVDIIICATGYKKEFPFLKEKYYKTPLIKKIIPEKYPNIAFIGFARPTMGSINNIAEMQSWWTTLYWKHQLSYSVRNLQWGRGEDPLDIENEHVTTIVIGNYYMKDLAMDMGIQPDLVQILITDPVLWGKIIHSTIHPMLFRLQGQFSYPGSREVYMNTLPSFDEKIRDDNGDLNPSMLQYYAFFSFLHILFILLVISLIFVFLYFLQKTSKSKKNLLVSTFIVSYVVLLLIYRFRL